MDNLIPNVVVSTDWTDAKFVGTKGNYYFNPDESPLRYRVIGNSLELTQYILRRDGSVDVETVWELPAEITSRMLDATVHLAALGSHAAGSFYGVLRRSGTVQCRSVGAPNQAWTMYPAQIIPLGD